MNSIFNENCITGLGKLADNSVDCCVTSPPYYGLRDYGHADQIGLEDTPESFIAQLVKVFREVQRVLKPEGTCWVNMGDSYASIGGGYNNEGSRGKASVISPKTQRAVLKGRNRKGHEGLKPKDLIGIPWMLAFALRADGWYLRSEIIWHKPNPMPESVTDRPTKSHEQLFLLTKSPKYYYDYESIKEPVTASTVARLKQDIDSQKGSERVPGKTNGTMKAVGGRSARDSFKRDNSKRIEVMLNQNAGTHRPDRAESEYDLDTRNKRSVWTVPTKPYTEAHFATFPPELIMPCIKAGCPPNGLVLDPFMGAGTTALVSRKLGRNYVGYELNPNYIDIANRRLLKELGPLDSLFAKIEPQTALFA